jgi:hypothetical protein
VVVLFCCDALIKSYSRLEQLVGRFRKKHHHRENQSTLVIVAAILLPTLGVMQSEKSAAKMGQNSSMWTHTKRPIRRGKITEMLISFARNNKFCPS